jgi:large subunit ribosomal protein L34e
MPRPSLRSRALRKIRKRVPGGASVIHYLRRNPSQAKCARCKGVLHGVASKRPHIMVKLAKTKKVPNRAYGGNLCHECARELLKEKSRRLEASR